MEIITALAFTIVYLASMLLVYRSISKTMDENTTLWERVLSLQSSLQDADNELDLMEDKLNKIFTPTPEVVEKKKRGRPAKKV